jgi:cardiolipin synthase
MADLEHRLRRTRRTLEGLLGVPATEGNRVDVLRNGDEIFPAMLDAIHTATSTVDLLSYIYWTGDIAEAFADACCKRAKTGVRVRILLDAVGAMPMNRDLVHALEEAGCQVEWFRKPTTWKLWESNHRTHRKVLICDEHVAFIGGVGIAREWEGDARNPDEWRDTHVRLRGPAVDGLRAAFLANWAETGRPLFSDVDRFPEQPKPGRSTVQVVACPAQIGWSDLCTTLSALIMLAEHRVRITTAYFVPDDHFLGLLRETCARGIEIDVVVPGPHTDKRVVQIAGQADYEPLLEVGVRIWQYQPTMLHAKVITIDGLVASVGSANFDNRSLRTNDEANLVVFDPEVVRTLDRHFAEDIAHCELIDPERWQRRGPAQRVKETVTELFDEQL